MKKMFLLGDSISLHYGPYLKEYLLDDFEIYRKPGKEEALKKIDHAVGGNGGDSSHVLAYIKERQAKNDLNFDWFVFNCGAHDIKRKIPEEKPQITLEEYERNLNEIYSIMEAHNIKCVFITSTPILEKEHLELVPGGVKRYAEDVLKYSEVAVSVAKKHNAPIIDLSSFVSNLPGEIYQDYAHFDIPTRKLQAAFIAGSLYGLLQKGM